VDIHLKKLSRVQIDLIRQYSDRVFYAQF